MIVAPTRTAGVVPPVRTTTPFIETPLLLSEKGAAITLLNWRGEPQERTTLTIRVPFAVREVTSVKQGKLAFTNSGQEITVSLPLNAVDILMLRP
jgi:hypothetical protein